LELHSEHAREEALAPGQVESEAPPSRAARRVETRCSCRVQLEEIAELTGGTESVRFTVINGGTYMSVRDIIMVVCKKDNNMVGEVWRNTSDKQKEELQDSILNFQFPSQGQRVQPVITLEGAMTQLIPFAELTGGTESVRFTVINGGTYMSVRDIIMAVCKKTAHDASDTWQDIPDEKKSEVVECLCSFQFSGQGQLVQPVITLKGVLKLIM